MFSLTVILYENLNHVLVDFELEYKNKNLTMIR